MNDQVTASSMPREASAAWQAGADLQGRQDLAVDRTEAFDRLRLDIIDAMDAHDFFDEIGLAVDIRTPGGNGDRDAFAGTFNTEAEARQDRDALFRRDFETRSGASPPKPGNRRSWRL
jgi:hypothetical protein